MRDLNLKVRQENRDLFIKNSELLENESVISTGREMIKKVAFY